MTNRYEITFDALKKRNEAAFIPFAVAGDPDPDKSEEIFRAYIDGGADILEIGYPFSDPIADGPVNQRASQRAIRNGMDHEKFFKLVKKLRSCSDIPVGILLYANTILHLGTDLFCRKASDAGIDSILVADMPPEESEVLQSSMEKHGIGRVFIVSELTPQNRIKYICSQIDSFVYVVSRLGATGTDLKFSDSISGTISRLKTETDKPLAVGFGISSAEHVRKVTQCGADGVIVGSALVKNIELSYKNANFLDKLREQVFDYKTATRTR